MSSRFSVFVLLCAAALLSPIARAQQMPPSPATPSGTAQPLTSGPTSTSDASTQMVKDAMALMDKNDLDGAIAKLSKAIELNPHASGPYVLRASLYCQKKLWTQAEADFTTASQLAPTNVVLKFNIIEVKFMQKQYDAARPGYLALINDPDMGDFAAYKVFLCDLAGGHLDVAQKELDAFNKVGGNPSYYYANAAWDIAHKKFDDAHGWLSSASDIYPPRKNAYYAEGLIYLGYLPLPKTAASEDNQ
jgi:tetratricopeptide (TPR) repeat protein